MRGFAGKGGRIDQLSVEAKLVYTAFCGFALAALAVSVLYYGELVGSSATRGVREYYAGEAPPGAGDRADPPAAAPEGGPAIELPPDEAPAAPPERIIVPITWRKLLEVTHFHLFTLPVFLLVIAHLFMLCRMAPALRFGIVLSGVLSSALHLLAPWLVFWGGGGWAWTLPVSGVWMTASMLLMTGWPMIAMWRTPKPA
jgi:hypothetical protein